MWTCSPRWRITLNRFDTVPSCSAWLTQISGCDIPISRYSGHLPWCSGRWRHDSFYSHQTFVGSKFLPSSANTTFVVLLTVEAARTLVHAFIISRVDYCNSVFGSTSADHLSSRSMPFLDHNDKLFTLKTSGYNLWNIIFLKHCYLLQLVRSRPRSCEHWTLAQ